MRRIVIRQEETPTKRGTNCHEMIVLGNEARVNMGFEW